MYIIWADRPTIASSHRLRRCRNAAVVTSIPPFSPFPYMANGWWLAVHLHRCLGVSLPEFFPRGGDGQSRTRVAFPLPSWTVVWVGWSSQAKDRRLRKCRRWTTERRVATVGQNCVWFWGFLSKILGLSRRLGGANPSDCPRGVWSPRLDWGESRVAEGRSLGKFVHTIPFVFYISYFVLCLYLYFLSQRAQPIVPTSVEGRACKLIYALPFWASLYILSISYSIVT
jgi:hypothetical protein